MNNTQKVVELVAQVLGTHSDDLPIDASSDNIADWDSMAQLRICMAFQERFGVEMDMDRIETCTSVSALAALLPR
jgi:acyl carrier protein